MSYKKMTNVEQKNVPFKPNGPCFSNHDLKQKSNVSFVKGKCRERETQILEEIDRE